MKNKEVLIKEIEGIPEEKLEEIIDFVRFLKSRQQTGNHDVTLLSQSSLEKDWLKTEEDEAWKDL